MYKMNNYIRTVMFFLICLSLCSCYSNYYGIYYIGKLSPSFRQKPASELDNKKIYEAVKNVVLEYGFLELERGKYDKPNSIHFGKGKVTQGKYEGLEGSSSITVILFTGPYPEIMIRDWKRTNESEFIISLKNDLEKNLSKILDMKGVVFERQHPLYW